MAQFFPNGVKGLADSKWSGVLGAAYRLVGLDLHSKPGLIRVAQKLTKHSGATVTELCKVGLPLSDGSKLWFSSESGKIWREVAGVYSLVYTNTLPAEPFVSPMKYAVLDAASNQKFGISDASQTGLEPVATMSIAAWLYLTSLPAVGEYFTIVDKYLESGDQRSYTFRIYNNNGSYELYVIGSVNGTAGGSSIVRQAVTINPGEWFHVALTYSTGNSTDQVKFFKNGAQVGATQSSLMGANNIYGSTAGFGIGGPYAENARNFDGFISHVMFWTNIQTPTAIANLYADGTVYSATNLQGFWKLNNDGLDETANNNDLTNSNTATFATFGSNIPESKTLGAAEFADYVIWATEDRVRSVALADIASFSSASTLSLFAVGDDTYHPFAKQNNELFIGDNTVIAKVSDALVFTDETLFNIAAPERITSLTPYDIDLLVGTDDVTVGRVLRWDTVSDSWNGQDDIAIGAVRAFIRDDNYVYALVGDFGDLYFYNGEKLESFKKIPGDYTPSATTKINPNAVGFLLGIPVFGLSNLSGNPALQGIYSFGSYSKDYPKILDLTYPISSGEFSGMEIGAIIVDGADMYASWKGATTVGVDKLDWTAKYASAYLETMQLISAKDRKKLKTLTDFSAEYASLPASTGIALKYDKNYTGSYTTLTSVKDTNLMRKVAHKSINKIGALQLRADITVSANSAPEIENFSYEIE